jgi:hypothetical protein
MAKTDCHEKQMENSDSERKQIQEMAGIIILMATLCPFPRFSRLFCPFFGFTNGVEWGTPPDSCCTYISVYLEVASSFVDFDWGIIGMRYLFFAL